MTAEAAPGPDAAGDEFRALIAERIAAADYAELVELIEAVGAALRLRVGRLGGYVDAAAKGLLDTIDRAHGVPRARVR